MSDYIDREDALSIALEGNTSEEIHHNLSRLPFVQIKDGEWTEGEWYETYDPNGDPFFRRRFVCSACNDWNTYGFTKYCPNCGAKMRNAYALTLGKVMEQWED